MTADRPYSDPEKAALSLVEIANTVEAVQDGRIHIELINGPFLFREKGTPQSCILVRAEGWPVVNDESFSRQQAAAAVIKAVESEATPETCATIAAGVAILLKAEGRAAQLEDAAGLRRAGMIPVLIALLADPETMTMTTTGVPRPTMH